jgi:effector-binding domain-containing protein
MKILKTTLFTLLGIIILIFIVSLLLPSHAHVERSIEIKSKPSQAFKIVNKLKEWKKWSPWHRIDSTTEWTYSIQEEGNGAGYYWKSNNDKVGSGSLLIVESIEDSLVKTVMNFGDMGNSYGTFTFKKGVGITTVTWSMDSDGNGIPFWMKPMTKYFYLMMDQMVGPDFEAGLKYMKEVLEAEKPLMVGDFEAEFRNFEGLNYVGIREKIKGSEIASKLGTFYAQLQNEIHMQQAEMTGPPFTINYSANGEVYDMMAAMSTNKLLNANSPIVSAELNPGKWLVVKYFGNYESMSPVYQKGFEFLAQNNLKPSGAPMEFYITDPMIEKDSKKWLTEIVFPYTE